jgi:hypothetical protein
MNSGKHFKKEMKEKISTIDLQAGLIVINPVAVIKNLIEKKEYFEAFANAITFFEYLGYRKLSSSLDGKISRKKLSRLSVSNINTFLYSLDLIDQASYSKIAETIKIRNKLIHPIENIGLRYKIDEENANRILNKAIEVIQLLQN